MHFEMASGFNFGITMAQTRTYGGVSEWEIMFYVNWIKDQDHLTDYDLFESVCSFWVH